MHNLDYLGDRGGTDMGDILVKLVLEKSQSRVFQNWDGFAQTLSDFRHSRKHRKMFSKKSQERRISL